MKWNLHAGIFLKRLYQHKILVHVLYWVVYVVFFSVVWGSADFNFRKTFAIELIGLPLKIVFVYITIYLLMPKLLFERKVYGFFLPFYCCL